MASKLIELREEIAAKQSALEQMFKEHPDLDFSMEQVEDIRAKNDELTDLGKKFDDLRAVEAMRPQPQAVSPVPMPSAAPQAEAIRTQKSLGTQFSEHANYKASRLDAKPSIAVHLAEVSVKTLMSTTAGFAPYNQRTDVVVAYAQRRPMVASLIPQDDTDAAAIIYMEETTNTNNAAPVAEGATKPESALAFTQRSVPIEVIATWLPVTKQQIEDVSQIRAVIDNRLTLMLALAEESQILNGNGTSPQLQGFYNKTGVQTQALAGGEPVPDTIFKAMTKVRFTGFADPTGVILHPNDWQDIRLLRTTDGVYIWGSPADAGPERIWGVQVVVTPAATENTGLVGDFQLYSHISRRQGVTIDVSESHGTYFVENKLAIRAEERMSLEIYRPSAFCLVTGI